MLANMRLANSVPTSRLCWVSLTQNCGLHMRRGCREHFPRHRLQMKLLVSDPGMHHGTCVTHMPWCMSESLTHGEGENVPGIPSTCTSRSFAYLVRGPMHGDKSYRWFIAILQYLQCVSNGNAAILHWAVDMIIEPYCGWTVWLIALYYQHIVFIKICRTTKCQSLYMNKDVDKHLCLVVKNWCQWAPRISHFLEPETTLITMWYRLYLKLKDDPAPMMHASLNL